MRVTLYFCLGEREVSTADLFLWEDSAEGHNYWSEVNRRLVPWPTERISAIMDEGYGQLMFPSDWY